MLLPLSSGFFFAVGEASFAGYEPFAFVGIKPVRA